MIKSVSKQVTLLAQDQYRIIPSHYPPINFFETLVSPSEMEVLWEIESITNERLRHEAGDLFLVAPEDRVSGPGASVVMAAFTHIGQASRFTDGTYGIYYAGLTKETAIRETVYHREIFLSATNEEAGEIAMRMYVGKILKPFHDLRHQDFEQYHHASDYRASKKLGKQLKQNHAWGIIYNSVRHAGGECIAALRPPAISIPKQLSHLRYIWDGKKITEVLDTKSIWSPA